MNSDIVTTFDNVISKDFITYDSLFEQVIENLYYSKDIYCHNILILSDCIDVTVDIVEEIFNRSNKAGRAIKIKNRDSYYKVRTRLKNNSSTKVDISIIDLKTLSDTNIIGRRENHIIVDIDGEDTNKLLQYIDRGFIIKRLKPMLFGWNEGKNFLTLFY